MDATEKKRLTEIYKIEIFKNVFNKLICGGELTQPEKEYILSCALLFSEEYKNDRRYRGFAELAYFIILKYSLSFSDFKPLFDFSINYGFYPIIKSIVNLELVENLSISSFLTSSRIDEFNTHGYVETFEQFKIKQGFLRSEDIDVALIAPTSFGKSSSIIDYIKNVNNRIDLKICIIVPSKSLLSQTYKFIKKADLGHRIIVHDEMYDGEQAFIAIFTQERALRLLAKNDGIAFDVVFIDEAHNLFSGDERAVLLKRFITKNRIIKPLSTHIYLSPLINDASKLVATDSELKTFAVDFNVKEPELYEYRLNGDIVLHNRFFVSDTNTGIPVGRSEGYLQHISTTSGNKNYIYLSRPVNIEKFSLEFADHLSAVGVDTSENDGFRQIIDLLSRQIHPDFYGIKCLKRGIFYIHGKLPDILKDYLESKFEELAWAKFIVANTVILEGVNLPLDALYVMDGYGLDERRLTNLIGRVNRLNDVFNGTLPGLQKLLPQIHFVNSEAYSSSDLFNKIKTLRSRTFKDKVLNPMLDSFDDASLDPIRDASKIERNRLLRENERFLVSMNNDVNSRVRKLFIELGINSFYAPLSFLRVLDSIALNISNIEADVGNLGVFDKIGRIFFNGIEELIQDYEFKRLRYPETRRYYESFMAITAKLPINEAVGNMVSHFDTCVSAGGSRKMMYFGVSYGEQPFDSIEYPDSRNDVYIDLSRKTKVQLVNLALVKIKLEEDFIGFKLNKLFTFLFDLGLITKSEYDTCVYGTPDPEKLKLAKIGMSPRIIRKLELDGQISNISYDSSGNPLATPELQAYLDSLSDDLFVFSVRQYL